MKHGKVNATLPKGTDPAEVTLEAGLELLAAKAAKPKKPRSRGRKSKK